MYIPVLRMDSPGWGGGSEGAGFDKLRTSRQAHVIEQGAPPVNTENVRVLKGSFLRKWVKRFSKFLLGNKHVYHVDRINFQERVCQLLVDL